ncbi:MliC family protein, partial [Rhizobium hidalgonense]
MLVTACQKTNESSSSADVSEQTRTAEGMSTASQDRVSQNNLSENEVKNNPNIIKTNYQCDQGKMVVAIYNNSNINSPRVTLTIDGRRFEMYNVIASSGTL